MPVKIMIEKENAINTSRYTHTMESSQRKRKINDDESIALYTYCFFIHTISTSIVKEEGEGQKL